MKIKSKDDADRALALIGELEDLIERREIEARKEIRSVEERLVYATALQRGELVTQAKMLESWAKNNKAEIFPEGRKSLELTRGIIGFRIPKGKIKLVLAVENIVERLKAKKLFDCIRIVEEPDLLKLANHSDEQLEAVGLKRTRPRDKFFYELKKTEVKNG
jgi:phage host-nuclease inhibitor protein Gam